jgi:hypothetical protein
MVIIIKIIVKKLFIKSSLFPFKSMILSFWLNYYCLHFSWNLHLFFHLFPKNNHWVEKIHRKRNVGYGQGFLFHFLQVRGMAIMCVWWWYAKVALFFKASESNWLDRKCFSLHLIILSNICSWTCRKNLKLVVCSCGYIFIRSLSSCSSQIL